MITLGWITRWCILYICSKCVVRLSEEVNWLKERNLERTMYTVHIVFCIVLCSIVCALHTYTLYTEVMLVQTIYRVRLKIWHFSQFIKHLSFAIIPIFYWALLIFISFYQYLVRLGYFHHLGYPFMSIGMSIQALKCYQMEVTHFCYCWKCISLINEILYVNKFTH